MTEVALLVRIHAKLKHCIGNEMVNEPRCDYHIFYPESIGWFLEDQAFSPSYDLARPATHWETETTCWRKKGVGGLGAK